MTNATKSEIRIDQALESHPILRGMTLVVERKQRRLVIEGGVSSYYEKQLAQELARRIEGIDEIENRLKVAWEETGA